MCMAEIVVKADTFMRLSIFASREWSRYYLQGVCIHQHPSGVGALLAATDGHRLGVWYDEKAIATAKRVILTTKNKAFMFACGIKPEDRKPTLGIQRHIVVDDETGVASLVDAPADNPGDAGLHKMAATFPGMLIDGTFPEYERVIPRGPFNPCNTSFNPRYLGDFKRMTNERECSLSIRTTEDMGPAIIRVDAVDCRNFVGVLMARRSNDLGGALPEWLPQLPEPPKSEQQAAA